MLYRFGYIDCFFIIQFSAKAKRSSGNTLKSLTSKIAIGVQTYTSGLALVPKLKFEHISLGSFAKMQVDLAAQAHSLQYACYL